METKMRRLWLLAAIVVASSSGPLAQARVDPITLCNAGKAVGMKDVDLRWEEWGRYPGRFSCAGGKHRQADVGAPYLLFQVDGTDDTAEEITVTLFIDDPKLTATTVAQVLQPLLHAMFEVTGNRMPDELVTTVNSLKSGRIPTALGTARATYKPAKGDETGSYGIEFTIPEAAPAAPTRR
jgi:hypothetical protein